MKRVLSPLFVFLMQILWKLDKGLIVLGPVGYCVVRRIPHRFTMLFVFHQSLHSSSSILFFLSSLRTIGSSPCPPLTFLLFVPPYTLIISFFPSIRTPPARLLPRLVMCILISLWSKCSGFLFLLENMVFYLRNGAVYKKSKNMGCI